MKHKASLQKTEETGKTELFKKRPKQWKQTSERIQTKKLQKPKNWKMSLSVWNNTEREKELAEEMIKHNIEIPGITERKRKNTQRILDNLVGSK